MEHNKLIIDISNYYEIYNFKVFYILKLHCKLFVFIIEYFSLLANRASMCL